MMQILPLFVAIPLGAGFLIPLVGRKNPRLCDVLGNVTTLVLFLMALSVIGKSGVYWMGGWLPRAGIPIGINLVLDSASVVMLITITLVSFLVTVYSIQYMDRFTSKSRFYSLFLLMVGGMLGVALTGDIFNLYVFLEIASIASYALVAFGCQHEELEASFRYLVLGSVGSTLILLGIAITYALTGNLNLAQISRVLAGNTQPLFFFALALFIAGFGLKSALIPFHSWLPDAHPSAPAPISAMLSGVLIKTIGLYAMARILFNAMGMTPLISTILLVLGTVSMVVGVLLAMGQDDIKRFLAYSSISQVGYIVLGFGLGTRLGIAAALFHLMNHAVFKSLLFLNAGAIEYSTGTRDMNKMGALRDKMPVTGATSLIGSMSIAGIPPFSGFWSKLFIIIAAVQAEKYGYAAWATGVSILTLAAFMRMQRRTFFGEPKEAYASAHEVPVFMRISMVGFAVLATLMGLLWLPQVKDGFFMPAAKALQEGFEYATRVLGM
ncbi:MAG: proton-conducting transporter membrane subunit [Candidatus Eisenbacteria bacterium]